MEKRIRSLVAVLSAVVLCFGLLPVSAFAVDKNAKPDEGVEQENLTIVPDGSMPGDGGGEVGTADADEGQGDKDGVQPQEGDGSKGTSAVGKTMSTSSSKPTAQLEGSHAAVSKKSARNADFTPDAWLDDAGVLHWNAEGEYYSRIDLGDLMFGPDSSDACEKPVNGEYTYDIENLFQTAEQLYGSIGDGDVSGLNGNHLITFVYYERQSDGTMKEVGRAQDAFTYTYTIGQLVKLLTPGNLSWTGDDGFAASWGSVEHAEGYWVRFYETVSAVTS